MSCNSSASASGATPLRARISAALSRIADLVTLVLVASMIYEVAARYVFGAPTIWAFQRMALFGEMPETYEQILRKSDVFLAGLPAEQPQKTKSDEN